MVKRYQRGNQNPLIERTDNTMVKRYQRGNQNPLIEDRQHNSEGVINTMVKRYQRGNQNPLIEGQTTQWSKDTKGVIRIR